MPSQAFTIFEYGTRYQRLLVSQVLSRLLDEPSDAPVEPGRFVDEPAQSLRCHQCQRVETTFARYMAHVRRCGRVLQKETNTHV